jgi:hypothetical protein
MFIVTLVRSLSGGSCAGSSCARATLPAARLIHVANRFGSFNKPLCKLKSVLANQ